MIPTKTEGPAKRAWHKSTRIKKKELQSDFTQDFGLDRAVEANSGERMLAGAGYIVGICTPAKPPWSKVMIFWGDFLRRGIP